MPDVWLNEAALSVSFTHLGFTFLPEMMKTFKELFPTAQVSMFEAQLSSFLPALRDGRLDFAIGTLDGDMQLQDLHVEPMFESEFVVVANFSVPQQFSPRRLFALNTNLYE